jgi:hypothetical protein
MRKWITPHHSLPDNGWGIMKRPPEAVAFLFVNKRTVSDTSLLKLYVTRNLAPRATPCLLSVDQGVLNASEETENSHIA